MAKVKFGLKNAYYAVATISTTDGTATYGTPVRLPGAVSISLEPTGENTKFYADDVAYFTAPGAAGYQGDLTLAMVPDEFRKDCLGEVEAISGVLVEEGNAAPKEFALLFEFTTDENSIRHALYNCTAKRPSVAGNTKGESTEVSTEVLTITASTVHNATLNKDIVKAKADSTATCYSAWYTTVYQP